MLRVKGIVVFQDLMRVEHKNEENRNANYVQNKAKSGKVGILLILRSVTSETIICREIFHTINIDTMPCLEHGV